MKTLITHIRPHLDDICAMWLMKKYLPEAKDASLDFIPSSPTGGTTQSNPDFIYIGVGRGEFDEHKGDRGQCATTLVFDFLSKKVAFDPFERKALEKIVEWVLLEDTGRLNTIEYREFSVPVILRFAYHAAGKKSAPVAELGFSILDAALATERNMVILEEDWQKRIAFTSRYGAAVGLETSAQEVDFYAYTRGFDVVAHVNKAHTYHTIRAKAGTTIDLTSVYEKIRERDPEAEWYFHHSKKMLICGGEVSPTSKPSKLTLEELIEILK